VCQLRRVEQRLENCTYYRGRTNCHHPRLAIYIKLEIYIKIEQEIVQLLSFRWNRRVVRTNWL